MDDRGWRTLSLVLALACMALLGVSAALIYSGGGNPSPSPRPSTYAVTTPGGGGSPTTSAYASASASPSPSASPTASPTATPRPTPNSPIANVTFSNMQLDVTSDAHATARTFTFTSDGPGAVTATIGKSSGGTVRLCAAVDGPAQSCWDGAKPALNGTADTEHSTWTVTLLGVTPASGITTAPVIDITFSWPTKAADIKLTHGRLQNTDTDSPLNGVTVTFKARAAGQIQVLADWPPLLLDALVTCADITNTPAVNGGERQYKGAGSVMPPATFTAQADHVYQIKLRDQSADNLRPDLSFELKFP